MKKTDSLQVVLSLRLRHQDAAEHALAEALRAMQAAQQLLAALQDDLIKLKTLPVAPQGELLHIADLLFRAQRMQALEHSCHEARTLVAGHKLTVAEWQQHYLEARRECEVVDALLKQRATQLQERQRKQDIKLADDLFLGRFNRKIADAGAAV